MDYVDDHTRHGAESPRERRATCNSETTSDTASQKDTPASNHVGSLGMSGH